MLENISSDHIVHFISFVVHICVLVRYWIQSITGAIRLKPPKERTKGKIVGRKDNCPPNCTFGKLREKMLC